MEKNRFDEIKNKFPNYIPINLLENELDNIKETEMEVYRVCKYGYIDKSFITTYEEDLLETNNNIDKHDKNDIGTYSMSCYQKQKDARRIFNMFKKFDEYKDTICMSKGITKNEIGIISATKNRTKKKDSHIDFWLYKDTKPIKYFSITKLD